MLFRFVAFHYGMTTDMKFIAAFFFFKGVSAKQQKKPKTKNHYSVIEQNALSDNYVENIIKCSNPKMTGQNDRQDESLTGQVRDQAGHCPFTGRYFEPWRAIQAETTDDESVVNFCLCFLLAAKSLDDLSCTDVHAKSGKGCRGQYGSC